MSLRKKREPLPKMYRCSCCNWNSERKGMCPTCAAGCVMHPERREASDEQA
jgi:hypothetical protein